MWRFVQQLVNVDFDYLSQYEKNKNCVHLIAIDDVDEDDENLGLHPHDLNLIKLKNIRIKGWRRSWHFEGGCKE